jgi:hypothetical protein
MVKGFKMTSVNYSDLLDDVAPRLFIPSFLGTESVLECAHAYAEAGWYLVPVKKGSKNPGSVLGEGWPQKSSNQKSQLDLWFTDHEDRGIALHTGRSGAIVKDVDNPEELTIPIKKLLRESGAPFQATRTNVDGRGHYVFALPYGEYFTNSNGGLGANWGEIRTGNSVIIVQPSHHEKSDVGGCYKWITIGEVPPLPVEISTKLRKRRILGSDSSGLTRLGDAELETFVAEYCGTLAEELLQFRIEQALPKFREGSRHNALTQFLLTGFADARAGLYPALDLIDAGLEIFTRFKPRVEWTSHSEFLDLVKWTAAASQQSSEEHVDQVRVSGLALVQPGVRAWLRAVSNV